MKNRIVLIVGAMLLVLLVAGQALRAADPKPRAVPPFKITSDTAKGGVDQPFVFDGNVKFQSPLHQTVITCQHMETNAVTRQSVTAITAKGAVTCTMLMEGKDKDTPGNRLEGHSEVMIYSMATNNRILRMVKQHDVVPTLVITDLKTNEKTTITGTEIEFNLETQAYQIKGGTQWESEGSAE